MWKRKLFRKVVPFERVDLLQSIKVAQICYGIASKKYIRELH